VARSLTEKPALPGRRIPRHGPWSVVVRPGLSTSGPLLCCPIRNTFRPA